MTEPKQRLEIAHITIDGKEIDEKTDIDKKKVTTVKGSDVLSMYLNKKPMFIKFYANWCGHCVHMDGDWKKLVEETKKKYNNENIAIVAVESKVIDKEISKEIDKIISNTKGLNAVNGFPTIGSITYVNDNAVFTPYNGNRTFDEMFKAVDKLVQGKSTMKGGYAGKRTLKRKHKTKRKQLHYKKGRSGRRTRGGSSPLNPNKSITSSTSTSSSKKSKSKKKGESLLKKLLTVQHTKSVHISPSLIKQKFKKVMTQKRKSI
jgi:thiol-disulfide isomerase/thioredoxin